MNTANVPWVEKYRPNDFDEIVIDNTNKQILLNIIKHKRFANLLFYGPPGTGKTTTIINLIKKYQKTNDEKGKDLVIHLNASDERGIDTIRNQINQFVNSKNLFGVGTKFIILDEVDYMTKSAQQALKYLICNYKQNVTFCLICNYISRIEKCLQDEFIKLRFNQLPTHLILMFLKNITLLEKINMPYDILEAIQYYFKSDIRSMINYLQANQHNTSTIKLINNNIYDKIISKIKQDYSNSSIKSYICQISIEYNIERKILITNLCHYIVLNYAMVDAFYDAMKFIFHSNFINIDYIIEYIIYNLKVSLFKATSLK